MLRKLGEHFQFIGESYIHGLMDGEAIDVELFDKEDIQDLMNGDFFEFYEKAKAKIVMSEFRIK